MTVRVKNGVKSNDYFVTASYKNEPGVVYMYQKTQNGGFKFVGVVGDAQNKSPEELSNDHIFSSQVKIKLLSTQTYKHTFMLMLQTKTIEYSQYQRFQSSPLVQYFSYSNTPILSQVCDLPTAPPLITCTVNGIRIGLRQKPLPEGWVSPGNHGCDVTLFKKGASNKCICKLP